MPTERQVGQHLFAFVIGMRSDHHDASERVQALQCQPDFDFSGIAALAVDGDESQDQEDTDRRARRPAA